MRALKKPQIVTVKIKPVSIGSRPRAAGRHIEETNHPRTRSRSKKRKAIHNHNSKASSSKGKYRKKVHHKRRPRVTPQVRNQKSDTGKVGKDKTKKRKRRN